METAEPADLEASFPLDALRSTLDAHPVRLAILFGSQARTGTHSRSDIDIAVELEGLEPGDLGFYDAFFGLSADLSESLGTDDIDLVDVHTLSTPLVRSVFNNGLLLVGTERRAERLRQQLDADSSLDRSPRERFDEALRLIDDHLT